MPRLLLGPLLRHVSETTATIWVETEGPCEVEVLGRSTRTFRVHGHHYALVALEQLEPGSTTSYEVALDGERVWPEEGSDFPPSSIRTLATANRVRIVFASCRTSAPHEPPWTLGPDEHECGRDLDALRSYGQLMLGRPREEWPDLALMLGDQVYADEVSPQTREFIRSRRDTSVPPGTEVADYEEYVRLYWEAWREPVVRWLLSTVSSAMIFDDHDVHDDWNISQAWLDEYRAKPWWDRRITAALGTYWVYQHLGNLPLAELEADELYRQVRELEDGWEVLEPWARRADRETDGARWSYARELAGSRLVVIDSRAGRMVGERREMVDDEEWAWIEERAGGDVDHLLLATSVPWLLPHGAHGVEAWNEAVCAGAWGTRAARVGERLRQGVDLEHWAAFGLSFLKLARLVEAVASGGRGRAPASILVLSGDVHFSYLAPVTRPRGESRVYQVTCSPLRNPLGWQRRLGARIATSRVGGLLAGALARSAGVRTPPLDWRLEAGPWFENVIATLDLDGRSARLRVEHAGAGTPDEPRLTSVLDRELAAPG